MRNLTPEEIEEALDDNGESEAGYIAVETTVQELADLGVGTACGSVPNQTFKALADKGYGHRKCRGWFNRAPTPLPPGESETFPKGITFGPEVSGMFHIKIQTDKTAEKIERIASDAEGSLRFEGPSNWDGFMEFEIE